MFQSLTIKNLAERQIDVIRQPTNTRPIIRLVEENGVQGIVKDFSVNGIIYRNTIGRFLLWREGRAYERLAGIKGIPLVYRKIDGLALVLSRVAGKSFEEVSGEERPDPRFFHMLTELIQQCHERGVAHCDLKRSANVMIDGFGRPYIVDWSAAIAESEFRLYPLPKIYKRFIEDDFKAITKLKMRFWPGSILDMEGKTYLRRRGSERIIRAIRDLGRRCLQKMA